MLNNQTTSSELHILEEYELLVFILTHNKSSAFLEDVRKHVTTGATVLLGRGSRPGKLLHLLGLNEIHRDIILIIQHKDNIEQILDFAKNSLKIDRPGHGIAFTIPLSYLQGGLMRDEAGLKETMAGGESIKYFALCSILDQGLGEEAVKVAEQYGARGATFLKGKGGAEYSSHVFDFPLSPQKDFVLMVLEMDKLEQIENALENHFRMENENTGIQYSYPLTRVLGLYGQEA